VVNTNGMLVANGTLGGTPFQLPLTLSAASTGQAAQASTPVLDLQLGPIHLNLLGLKLDTSPICLDITAQQGSGNLLGNLVAGIANLLNQGSTQAQALGTLGAMNLRTFTTGLRNLINGALQQVTSLASVASGGSVSSVAATQTSPATNILHLAVGPLDLNLLGLAVHLDNCSDGPVTVDLTAQTGPGDLLGNLLGGLADALNGQVGVQSLLGELGTLTREIQSVSRQAGTLLPLAVTGVSAEHGALVATGHIGRTALHLPLVVGLAPSSTASAPVLQLHLNPVHLNLLGLKIDTSPICLDITAQQGPGNVLGNLVYNLAHALDQGSTLRQALATFNATDLNTLTTGLQGNLGGALNQLTSLAAVAAVGSVSTTRTTSILHLAVGPLDLNLLGLAVHLDNCSNGPVTVDISAQRGPGRLLGNLLAGLANLLNNSTGIDALIARLDQIAGLLRR
jgi:hypothetical protein